MIVVEALIVIGIVCVIAMAIYAGYKMGKASKGNDNENV